MRFLSRLTGSVLEICRGRQEHRSARRRRSALVLEMLDRRSLLSITGVTLSYGSLMIQAPAGSHGNVATVSIDPSTADVKVSLNGQSEEFSPSLVASVTYKGGSGGGDTFTNNTSFTTRGYAFGANNSFTGGTGYNYFYFLAPGNTYNARPGSFTDVFEYGGSDTINNPDDAGLQIYSYA
jgi:hypothetical protein